MEAAKCTDMIATNIRVARAVNRVGQVELAARMRALGFANWRASTVSRTEHGKRHLLVEELFGLAEALETTVIRLLRDGR